jgi:hypothetical protein
VPLNEANTRVAIYDDSSLSDPAYGGVLRAREQVSVSERTGVMTELLEPRQCETSLRVELRFLAAKDLRQNLVD